MDRGYECTVTVFHIEDLVNAVTTKTLRVAPESPEGGLRNLGDLVVEASRGKKETKVFLKGVVDASPGAEEATFALVRVRHRGDRVLDAETLGRTATLSGNAKNTSWIDNYKVDVACKVVGLPELAGDGRGGHSPGPSPVPSPFPSNPPDDGRGGRPPEDGRGGHDAGEHV